MLADRFNAGKLQWSLVDFEALKPMVEVLEFGAEKYSPDNWKKGLPYKKLCDSLLRHVFEFMAGDDYDPESQKPLVGHILCNAMFLSYMFLNRSDMDDRVGETDPVTEKTDPYVQMCKDLFPTLLKVRDRVITEALEKAAIQDMQKSKGEGPILKPSEPYYSPDVMLDGIGLTSDLPYLDEMEKVAANEDRGPTKPIMVKVVIGGSEFIHYLDPVSEANREFKIDLDGVNPLCSAQFEIERSPDTGVPKPKLIPKKKPKYDDEDNE